MLPRRAFDSGIACERVLGLLSSEQPLRLARSGGRESVGFPADSGHSTVRPVPSSRKDPWVLLGCLMLPVKSGLLLIPRSLRLVPGVSSDVDGRGTFAVVVRAAGSPDAAAFYLRVARGEATRGAADRRVSCRTRVLEF